MKTFPLSSLDVELLTVPDFVAVEDDVLAADVDVVLRLLVPACCDDDVVEDVVAWLRTPLGFASAEILSEILGVEVGAIGGVYGILPLTERDDGVVLI